MKTYTYPDGQGYKKLMVGRIDVAGPYDGCVLRNVTDRIVKSDNQYVYWQGTTPHRVGETSSVIIMCRSKEDENDVVRILNTLNTLGIKCETDFDFYF